MTALQQLRRMMETQRPEGASDAQLVERFVRYRDEGAFAVLMRRHGPMVLATCRQVLGGSALADDAFQAAFLVLARKAASLGKGASVAAWLHRVAYRLAVRAKADEIRRSRMEHRAQTRAPASPPAEAAWREMHAILDEELARLPEKHRAPLVLCYLEGLTHDEAALRLGWPAGTVKSRLARGRDALRGRLARRGLTLSTAAFGAALAARTGTAAPAAIQNTTLKAALCFAEGNSAAAVVSSSVATLVDTSSRSFFRLKLTAVAVLLASLVVGGVGMAVSRRAASPNDQLVARAREQKGDGQAPKTETQKQKADLHVDPLPPGAVARLGTRRLCGPWDPMWAGFSSDGTKLASQNWCGVTVWDAVTGVPLVERTDYRYGVKNVVVNGVGWRADGTGVAIVRLLDASYFVSAFTDPAEKLPTPPRAAMPPKPLGSDGLHPFALSTDATQLAVVQNPTGKRFTIDILPATVGRPVASLKPERTLGPFPGPCQEIRYMAGNLVFLTGPWEDEGAWSIAIIDPVKNVVTRTILIPPPAYCPWRHMLSLSADARFAAIPTRTMFAMDTHEGTIRVWDLAAGKELWKLPFPQCGYGTGHAFTPDGKRLITSTDKTYFQVWDLATGKETARSPPPGGAFHESEASAVAISPDGKQFATARQDGRVDFWDTATGKALNPLATHRGVIDAVAVSPDGRLAATLGHDHSVRVWELATGKPGCVIPAPMDREPNRQWSSLESERQLAFTPDGRGLVFVAGSQVAMADPATGKRLDLPRAMRGRKGIVGGFSADGRSLATFADGVVTLWEWPAGTLRLTVTIPLGPDKPLSPEDNPEIVTVRSAALSPEGRFLFTNSVRWSAAPARGGMHNANDVWDARTGKHLHRLATPKIEFPSAAFAPDSSVFYLGGLGLDDPQSGRKLADGLSSWDPTTGKLVRRFGELYRGRVPGVGYYGRRIVSVALSPDGRLLAGAYETGSLDQSVWVHETLTGRVIKTLPGHVRTVTGLAFSPDSRRLVSVSGDQTGLVWDVTLPALGGKTADKGLAVAWDRLAALEPELGYAGMAALAAAPAESLPLLRAKLRPASVPTDADLDQVVGQLDAEAFADREKASAELEQFGPNAVAGVKDRMTRVASEEVRQRLTRFLAGNGGPDPSPYLVRCVRGVGVLEAIGTSEARQLLAELAKGAPEAPLTREAQSSLNRLAPPRR